MVAKKLIFKTSFSTDDDPKCIETWVEMGNCESDGNYLVRTVSSSYNASSMYTIMMHLMYLSIVSETLMQLTVDFALQQEYRIERSSRYL